MDGAKLIHCGLSWNCSRSFEKQPPACGFALTDCNWLYTLTQAKDTTELLIIDLPPENGNQFAMIPSLRVFGLLACGSLRLVVSIRDRTFTGWDVPCLAYN